MIGHLINLDRAPERWASVSRIAAERGLAIERVPAVDGRDPEQLRQAAVAPGTALTPVEIACFESHRAAWRRIAAGEAPFGLVLEDDVFLAAGIVGFLDALPAAAAGLDLVKLNAHPRGMILHARPIAEVAGRRLLRPAQRTSDASAYVISRAFAARALELHSGYREALDLALFEPGTGARIAQVDPALAIQQRYADFRFLDEGAPKTQIQPDRAAPRPRPGALTALRREAARLWRRRLLPSSRS
ncbi:glycosyltransferase family 25 protein [Amaricoccus sp.]|uniref:glycosyltransferase family 25 protein n=1 Tax=Amaricoccus sp. TaxID=1872485 RepID=UPI002612941F|nr:glycosyltransferase family 25 protein [Amaricoccus sp.]HRO13292.1 glycosyltransferase family 25 protein [Amaricoccus sp.]